MKNDIILSILIPTYNRLLFLETGVENLIDQIKSLLIHLILQINHGRGNK